MLSLIRRIVGGVDVEAERLLPPGRYTKLKGPASQRALLGLEET
jgi:hypothetical protein